MTYRVLLTGSRAWTNPDPIEEALKTIARRHPDMVLVHGACPNGADNLADRIAERCGIEREPHPADWDNCGTDCPQRIHRKIRANGTTYCPLAGPRRNRHMVELGADEALVFITGRSWGTADCLRRIKTAGIPYRRWTA